MNRFQCRLKWVRNSGVNISNIHWNQDLIREKYLRKCKKYENSLEYRCNVIFFYVNGFLSASLFDRRKCFIWNILQGEMWTNKFSASQINSTPYTVCRRRHYSLVNIPWISRAYLVNTNSFFIGFFAFFRVCALRVCVSFRYWKQFFNVVSEKKCINEKRIFSHSCENLLH